MPGTLARHRENFAAKRQTKAPAISIHGRTSYDEYISPDSRYDHARALDK